MSEIKFPKYDYPNKYCEHMITVKKVYEAPNFSPDYDYLDNSKKRRKKRKITFFLLCTIVRFVAWIRYGFRIKGKKVLKTYKKELENGAVTICNHVVFWDYIFVMLALKPYRPYVIVWLENFLGKDMKNIRNIKGIPIPEDFENLKYFDKAVTNALNNKEFIHVYPEASMWFYYNKIRPFKKGAFNFAVKTNKPVLPLIVTYHKRKGLMKLFFRKPGMHITILEPVFPKENVSRSENINYLINESRNRMSEYSGFELIDQNKEYQEEK